MHLSYLAAPVRPSARAARRAPAAVLLLLLALAGCGGGADTEFAFTSHTGVWVVDVDRTAQASGQALVAPQVRATLEQRLGPSAYRLELRADGTFELRLGSDEGALAVAGTWVTKGSEIRLVTTHADGQPVSEEPSASTLRVEGDWLVAEEQGKQTYLRRS